MNTVYIFGDSYAEYEFHEIKKLSWVRKLHKTQDVKNFAISGTGLEYSLNQFINIVTSQPLELKNSSCLFFVSEYWRPYFNFWKTPVDQNKFFPIIFDSFYTEPKPYSEKDLKKYKAYKEFCNEYYQQKEPLKAERDSFISCVSTINSFSCYFKNVLIWPCFKSPTDFFNDFSFNKNVQYIHKSLFEIVGSPKGVLISDDRVNHLNEQNNQIMYEEIKSRVKYNTLVNYNRLANENI